MIRKILTVLMILSFSFSQSQFFESGNSESDTSQTMRSSFDFSNGLEPDQAIEAGPPNPGEDPLPIDQGVVHLLLLGVLVYFVSFCVMKKRNARSNKIY